MRKILTKEIKDDVCNFYLSRPMSLNELAEHANLCNATVMKILDEYGIERYPKSRIFNPDLDETYFKNIDTQNKAYFLGLIIADGNVFKNGTKQASISISLQDGDKYLLEKFKEELHSNTSVTSDGRGTSMVAIRSDKIAKDLSKYGVVQRVTFTTTMPTIPRELYPHLIRGIMDGDGCVQAKQTDKRNRYCHRVGFSGTEQLMNQIRDLLVSELDIFPSKVYTYSTRSLSTVSWAAISDMQKIYHYIYDNADVYLRRKKDIFDEAMAHYHLN